VDFVVRLLDAGVDHSHYYHIMDVELDPEQFRPWMSDSGVQRMANAWQLGVGFHGLHMLTPAGEASAAYVAFKMLYAMEGQRIPVARPAPDIGVLATRTECGCRLLLWSHHHEGTRTTDVSLSVCGLPTKALVERHYQLGGILNDTEGVIAIRQGDWCLREEAARPASVTWNKTVTVRPYAVHLFVLETVEK
jgi:hypothetical protein